MSNKRLRRAVNGILLLDKPAGVSSNTILQQIKYTYCANKAGHTGSLDVPATGLLPICFGEATKLSAYLLAANKSYYGTCRLGVTTKTDDAASEVISNQPVPHLSKTELEEVLAQFIGDIEQVPPMYSALKYAGRRLYQLAYQGVEVVRKPRCVTIYQLQLLQLQADNFSFFVTCTKGTYIRTLAADIGRVLGCGAHLSALRRVAVGPFDAQHMYTPVRLQALAKQGLAVLDNVLLPPDQALTHLPKVSLSQAGTVSLYQGQCVDIPKHLALGLTRVYNHADEFIGMGEIIAAGLLKAKRLFKQ